uniref:Uncharacterized protein n=1 Tax=Anguilla anguilla TaxID=7936 RepID=A0A0E9VR21_ANGAN
MLDVKINLRFAEHKLSQIGGTHLKCHVPSLICLLT